MCVLCVYHIDKKGSRGSESESEGVGEILCVLGVIEQNDPEKC